MTTTFKQFLVEAKIMKNYLKQILKLFPIDTSAQIKERAGKTYHVRINSPKSIEEIISENNIPIDVELSPLKIASGTYDTYEATLNKDLNADIPKGSSFYIVNTFFKKGVASRIKKKELTPDKLKLNSGDIKLSEFNQKVEDKLDTLDKFSEDEIDYLKQLLQVSDSHSDSISIDAPDSLTSADLNIIAQDFGEIFSLNWVVNQYKDVEFIRFPSANEALFDSVLILKDKSEIKISSKVGEGGPPSINAIVDIIKDEDNEEIFNKFDQDKIELIKSIKENSVVDGILQANIILETDGIKKLSELMDTDIEDITAPKIETWLKSKSLEEIIDITVEMKHVINRGASTSKLTDMVNSGQKLKGIIISPLGYYLTDILNKDKEFSDILNFAAQQIEAIQVYTDLTKSKVSFKIKNFKEEKFKWHYNANIGDPGLKKISFKMQ